ncbi:hypothetical protein ACJMK2_031279 [Sinanodonta woodiana]|uniref:Tetratricopeptide repeat protein 29 n=1 Tax=Sinanodonta woodiana TaxID=1069815 RepID=A0ABD3WZN5_SINWO
MAATLPPISGGSGGLKQGQPVQFSPSPPKGPPSGRLKPLKRGTGARDGLQPEKPRSQQAMLTKRQTTAYRNSYKHNLCVEMLTEGYHRSFCELFALIHRQEEERLSAGPESLLWNMTLLKDQHEKLDMLKTHLTRIEYATRKGDFYEVYKSRFELARYFQQTGDKWLADHFFMTCLQTSTNISNDSGKTQAEGYCNVGLAQEENGEYYHAMENFEQYYKLAVTNKDWITADNRTFHTDACIHLSRIYETIGTLLQDEEDKNEMLEYLKKAFDMAQESEIHMLTGEAAYRLGQAYEMNGDAETALLHLNNYLAICRSAEDNDGIGKACDAIAKALERDGKVEKSIEYLKQFVQVAEKSGNEQAYSKACHNLGIIFNKLGNYEEATKSFDKAYTLARSMGDVASININRVQFGIAMAHKMQTGVARHIVMNSRQALERIVEWKSSRLDEFEKPFPKPVKLVPRPLTPKELSKPNIEEENEVPEGNQEKVEEERKENTFTSIADTDTHTETTESG